MDYSAELTSGPARTTRRSAAQRYLAGFMLAVAASAAILLPAARASDELKLLAQLLAITLAAAFGGFGPGVIATLVALAIDLLFTPHHAISIQLGRLLLEGMLISLLGGLLDRARQRAQSADTARAILEKQMLEVGDKERRRFGHDLHDGLGQQLTGIALLSESLAHELELRELPQADQAEKITALVSEAIGWTRELARGLSPLTLETDGLAAAVEELAVRANRLFGIDCRFDCEHSTLPIEDESAIHIYRIVQEALSNSVRHGKARHVLIRAAVETDRLVFTVTDDGSGLSAKTVAKPGIGLQIMRYRANLIGARLTVARETSQGGTVVSCSLPVHAQKIMAAEME